MAYEPTLASIQQHPLPDWYDDAKFGIFIHWGLYSIPAFAPKGMIDIDKLFTGEASFGDTPYAEWYQNSLRIEGSPVHQYHLEKYGADFAYEDFAPQFNTVLQAWEPQRWAELFATAGAKYVVLVTKHHDGFLMWNSQHPCPRNPQWQTERDVVGELTAAVSAKDMKMGLYYSSLLDWSFTKTPITSTIDLIAGSDTSHEYLNYVEKHWLELIERYDPWILWSDIGYPPGYDLPKLIAGFYNRKPEGVINDRWMQLPRVLFSRAGRWILSQLMKSMDASKQPKAKISDFFTPEYAQLDHIESDKWETCRGIGNSFGYMQYESDEDYASAEELVRMLADVVSKNGNLLLNVGPCSDGSIHPMQVKALEGIGEWMRVNGEAIYGTRPWKRFGDAAPNGGEVRYTSKVDALNAIVTAVPTDGVLVLPGDVGTTATMMNGEALEAKVEGDSLKINLLDARGNPAIPVLRLK
ncbi:MAG: alpha-L-fucosidase [Anaerolineae bacterium]|jgi:alpha-L-fucosidase|nr:alpha-L-fucosidase [Anaerolineae bacterium]